MNALNTSNYHITSDDERIFFQTNFPLNQFDENKHLLVFNYGLVCSNEHWREQIKYFHEHHYQILVHDYRGHYNSSGEHDFSKINFKQFCVDLKEILDKYFKNAVTIQLGHSMGVNTTLEFAKLYPENCVGIILISGTIFPPHDVMFESNIMELAIPYLKKFVKTFPKLWKNIWSYSGFNPLIQEIIWKGGFNKDKTSIEFIQTYLLKMSKLHPELFFHLTDEMKKHDIIGYLEDIRVPALVMGGDKDNVCPTYLQRMIHNKLPNSEFYIFKDGSHVPNMDFPKQTNERINVFIDNIINKLTNN